MGRKTKADIEKQRAEEERKAAERADDPEDMLTRFVCWKCGKAFRSEDIKYTVKFRSGRIAITCEVCAKSKSTRILTPYISYDAVRFLNIPEARIGGW